ALRGHAFLVAGDPGSEREVLALLELLREILPFTDLRFQPPVEGLRLALRIALVPAFTAIVNDADPPSFSAFPLQDASVFTCHDASLPLLRLFGVSFVSFSIRPPSWRQPAPFSLRHGFDTPDCNTWRLL